MARQRSSSKSPSLAVYTIVDEKNQQQFWTEFSNEVDNIEYENTSIFVEAKLTPNKHNDWLLGVYRTISNKGAFVFENVLDTTDQVHAVAIKTLAKDFDVIAYVAPHMKITRGIFKQNMEVLNNGLKDDGKKPLSQASFFMFESAIAKKVDFKNLQQFLLDAREKGFNVNWGLQLAAT